MVSPIHKLFAELGVLSSPQILKMECERRGVKIREHPEIKELFCLKYNEKTAYDKSWDNFNRRCRGLVIHFPSVDSEGTVISHPFDKFHNIDEVPETNYAILNDKGPFRAYEKLDGTMIVAGWNKFLQTWILNTGSEFVNEYTETAYKYFNESPLDPDLQRYTLVFELIDPALKNVIDYTRRGYSAGLYLLGMRVNRTDRRLSLLEIENLQNEYPSLKRYKTPKPYTFKTLDEVVDNCKILPHNEEGYVLYYPDETMVKVKSLNYLKVHRLVWNYTDDRVLEMMQTGTENELRQYLTEVPEEYSKDILLVISEAKRAEIEWTKTIYDLFAKAPKSSRKEFALWVKSNVQDELKPFLFSIMDNKPIDRFKLYDRFRNHLLMWKECPKLVTS